MKLLSYLVCEKWEKETRTRVCPPHMEYGSPLQRQRKFILPKKKNSQPNALKRENEKNKKKKRATEIVLWAERVECLALPRQDE